MLSCYCDDDLKINIFFNAKISGAILMASGRVPNTIIIFLFFIAASFLLNAKELFTVAFSNKHVILK